MENNSSSYYATLYDSIQTQKKWNYLVFPFTDKLSLISNRFFLLAITSKSKFVIEKTWTETKFLRVFCRKLFLIQSQNFEEYIPEDYRGVEIRKHENCKIVDEHNEHRRKMKKDMSTDEDDMR